MARRQASRQEGWGVARGSGAGRRWGGGGAGLAGRRWGGGGAAGRAQWQQPRQVLREASPTVAAPIRRMLVDVGGAYLARHPLYDCGERTAAVSSRGFYVDSLQLPLMLPIGPRCLGCSLPCCECGGYRMRWLQLQRLWFKVAGISSIINNKTCTQF